MDEKLICPPNQYYPTTETTPLVYLGGNDDVDRKWETKAIELIRAAKPDVFIANPAEHTSPHDFTSAVGWRIYHQRMASVNGIVMFWMGKVYGDDGETRHELAEWITHLKYRKIHQPEKPLKLVVGIDPEYYDAEYLIYRLYDDLPDFSIHNTLEVTIAAVVELL